MNLTNRILSNFIYAIAKVLSAVLGALIQIVESIFLFIRNLTKTLTRGCFTFVSMGGCLFVLIFAAPITIRLLLNPVGLFVITFSIIFLIYGVRFAGYLRYLKYITTEFLFNLANHLRDEQKYAYKAFNEYKVAYQREVNRQKEEQERAYYEQQREQQRRWAEQFAKQWNQQWNQQSSGRSQSSYGPSFGNFPGAFKQEYEKNCDILGVPYNADEDQIKTAYREKAKKYHPDINQSPNASKLFQEAKEAYEFLSEENIQRYKNR